MQLPLLEMVADISELGGPVSALVALRKGIKRMFIETGRRSSTDIHTYSKERNPSSRQRCCIRTMTGRVQ
jgi:hypothetical protein